MRSQCDCCSALPKKPEQRASRSKSKAQSTQHWAKMKIKNIIASNIFSILACGREICTMKYKLSSFFFVFRSSVFSLLCAFCNCTALLFFRTLFFCFIQNIIMIHNMLLYVLSDCVQYAVCSSIQFALCTSTCYKLREYERHGIVNSNTYYFSSIYLILNSFWNSFFVCVSVWMCAFVVDIAVFRGCWCELLIHIHFESANGE